MKPKVIAFYLPQFHETPENNKWWGQGFTEWTNTKKSKPLFEGHNQPREPLDDNYYCLLDASAQEWQAELAKKYGVYGFCYYHYWFNGKMLIEKPMENMLKNPKVDITLLKTSRYGFHACFNSNNIGCFLNKIRENG